MRSASLASLVSLKGRGGKEWELWEEWEVWELFFCALLPYVRSPSVAILFIPVRFCHTLFRRKLCNKVMTVNINFLLHM